MRNIELRYGRHHFDKLAGKISSAVIPYYDLTLVLRGSLEYIINGEKVLLGSGDVICMPPGTMRERVAGRVRSDYVSFNFTSSEPVSIPLKTEKAVAKDVVLLISAYDELRRQSFHDGKEKNAHLLACLLLTLEERGKEIRTNPLVVRITKYIHRNLSQKITLAKIGKKMFFSPVYCDTVFKREMGRSIIDYLIEARMNEAKRLLLDGGIALTAVAESVGYTDYNYFSRTFKKRTGYTPGQYRKMSV